MSPSINNVLPEPVSDEVAAAFREVLKRKVKGCAGVLVRCLRALEERYGKEVYAVCEEALAQRTPRAAEELKSPEEDLQEFCAGLERGCSGSHEWVRVEDKPGRIGYSFTACLWAEVFNELDAADIGWWWCAGDEPATKAYNPALGFERTKTLMQGHDECDHVFKVDR